jgi:hypothetical protein
MTFPGIQSALAQALDESNEHDKMMQKSNNGQQCSMRYGDCTCGKVVCPYFVGLTNMKAGVEDPNQILIGKSCI